jgi:hypothetical protein
VNLVEQDHQFLTEALPQLRDYLLSNELYWPLGGTLPRLTSGAVLLTLARLSALQPEKAAQFHPQVARLRAQWRTAWEQKIAREMANRLRLWSNFLSDYREAPEQYADAYPHESRGRAILQILLDELPNAPEKSALADLDVFLKIRLVPGDFLWEPGLRAAFQPEKFWFLYGKLHSKV